MPQAPRERTASWMPPTAIRSIRRPPADGRLRETDERNRDSLDDPLVRSKAVPISGYASSRGPVLRLRECRWPVDRRSNPPGAEIGLRAATRRLAWPDEVRGGTDRGPPTCRGCPRALHA